MSRRKEHWEKVYQAREPDEVSWYQKDPEPSLRLILATGVETGDRIIDVGGGASVLADRLLARGFERVCVLDVSGAALAHAKRRLGGLAARVEWIEADATDFRPTQRYKLWHDRAVFHFLADPEDRRKYIAAASSALEPGGALILATFALDGPEKCSGLPVRRHDAASVRAEFGAGFALRREETVPHETPWGTVQKFDYFVLEKL